MTDTEPPYRRVAADIRRRVEAGELAPGDLVPSARQITQRWGVAIATATKALALLRQEGLTTVRPGIGTVVASTRPGARRRERRDTPELSRDRIVATAIAIADTEGFAEVSMRRVATELGVATMSLYRHVPSKDELTLFMIDAAFGPAVLPATPPPGWRARLELAGRVLWRLFRRHPWLAPTLSLTRPQPAMNGLRFTEWVLASFDGTRLSMTDRLHVHLLMFSYVRGLATTLEAEAEAERDTGITGNEWMDRGFGGAELPPDVPVFRHLVEIDDFDLDLDHLFGFGLDRLLDGLATYIDGR
ncbi:TetR/AcrR family transcriptional regulator C-terminal domain-containing protein [Dactylosporangium aurantiacum]|uniref:TetR/AcrR family transcriptional regulator C-terminal domain-containing protein n=1 Tax=Dactylosporangium aurantiacum TaxID=35754 RepID=UPI000527683C|nr:TetR/AcrR family transcriptional regulator C-terminal domain-containing protein [Dactylosporangium aurantiacum]MDG6103044.1 TetR/AcrR family transcriptional regulator C-terminal domain-containing protein [Dactylosporangium aurantiacum]